MSIPTDYEARPSLELLELLLAAPGYDDDSWDVISLLRNRGQREVFERALEVLSDPDPDKRTLAADLLAQFGDAESDIRRECFPPLRLLLTSERHPRVLDSAAIAFLHNKDPQAIPHLLALRSHAWPMVRLAVTRALAHQDERADVVTGLLDLCRDSSPDVRDWATFGLGTLMEADTPEIREALLERAEDSDFETRGEALLGLAKRGAPGALGLVIDALEAEVVGALAIEAAWELGSAGVADAELWSALVALASWWDVNEDLLAQAISACEPGSSAD